MSYLDPSTWRSATEKEVVDYYTQPPKEKPKKRERVRRPDRNIPGLLVFRSLLNPLDVYAYLHARFGEPNGMQSMMIHKLGMVQEDSGNMINWDYVLYAGDLKMQITGAGREVHVMIEGDLADNEWFQFASAIKQDLGKYGRQKSAFVGALEKWSVFPNRYKSMADRCAELQSELSDVVEQIENGIPERPRAWNKRANEQWGKKRTKLTNSLVASSVQLSVLTPIMFESFIGLISAVLMRPNVRKNRRLSEAFRRSPLDLKIYDLATRCRGFARPIEEANPVMRRYWKVVNERNDIVHGNVDPVRDSLEIVYFKGKTPIFPQGGDPIEGFFESLIRQYEPGKVLQNYLLAHEFIIEILNHMEAPVRASMIRLMDDSQPGWDDKRGKLGRLFPDFIGSFHLPGTRYDTDLRASVQDS